MNEIVGQTERKRGRDRIQKASDIKVAGFSYILSNHAN